MPATAAAAYLTVTVVTPAAPGYLRVRPDGGVTPVTSNLNFAAGQTVANSVLVPLGKGGRVLVDNLSAGQSQVVVDVTAYTTGGVPVDSGAVAAVSPTRLLDTRAPATGPAAPLAPGASVKIPVLGRGGLPLAGVGAVVLNLTATQPTAPGYLVATAGDTQPSGTSNLNWSSAGQTVANQVQVPVDADGNVRVTAGASSAVHVVVDVQGYVVAGRPAAPNTVALLPASRIFDTRSCCGGTVGASGKLFDLDDVSTLPPVEAGDGQRIVGLVATVTVTDATAAGYLTAWSGSGAAPVASNANWSAAGQTVAATVVIPVVNQLHDQIDVVVGGVGQADVIVDALGYVLLDASAAPPGPAVESTGFQQGPTHDGHAAGSLPSTMTRRWDVDFGANEGMVGYPVIADNEVFVVTNLIGGMDPTPYKASLWAYDLAGNHLWGPVQLDGSYHKNRMAWDDGRLYVVDDGGGVAAYAPGLGLEWRRSGAEAGTGDEPTLAAGGGRLYALTQQGDALGAFDGSTGNILWTAPIPDLQGSEPTVTLDSTGVYVGGGASGGATYKFDVTGHLLWHYTTGEHGGGGGTPASHDGRLWTRIDNGSDGTVLDASTGSRIRSYSSDRAVAFSGEIAVTASNGAVTAVSENDGSQVWTQGGGDEGDLAGAILATDDTVYVAAADDTVRGFSVITGQPVWTGSTPTVPASSSSWDSGMAIGDGLLLVPNGSHLTAFG